MDNQHKGEGQGPKFERLKIDIEHLDLSAFYAYIYVYFANSNLLTWV